MRLLAVHCRTVATSRFDAALQLTSFSLVVPIAGYTCDSTTSTLGCVYAMEGSGCVSGQSSEVIPSNIFSVHPSNSARSASLSASRFVGSSHTQPASPTALGRSTLATNNSTP